MTTIERLENISVESEGVARASFTPDGNNVPVGIHKLKGYYDKNNTYNAAESELANFVVNAPTAVSVPNYIGNTGETINIVADVTSNNLPVNEGSVQFKVAGTVVGTANVVNGKAVLAYTIACENQSTVQAIYQGVNGKYAISNSELRTITVRADSNIFIDNIVIDVNETVVSTGTATYTTSNNETTNINTGNIAFFFDGVQHSTIQIDSGTFELNTALPSYTPGLHQCNIVLDETDVYESAEYNFTILVRYPVTIENIPTSVTLGEQEDISARVTTTINGSPSLVTEGTVLFKILANGQILGEYTAQVVNGIATFTLDVPSEVEGGLSVESKYQGSTNFAETYFFAEAITIRQDASIEVEDITATVGDTVYLRAFVTDEDDVPITTGTVDFEILESTPNP